MSVLSCNERRVYLTLSGGGLWRGDVDLNVRGAPHSDQGLTVQTLTVQGLGQQDVSSATTLVGGPQAGF